MEIERRLQSARVLLQMRHVIAVMMRDDDGVDAARKNLAAQRAHCSYGSFWADSGVDQNARPFRFDD